MQNGDNMTRELTPQQIAARESARVSGRFGEQQRSAPEAALGGGGEANVGALIEYEMGAFTRRGIVNGDGTASHFTTRDGRRAVNILPIPDDAVVVAPAGSEEAAKLASDLRGAAGSQNVGAALLAAIGEHRLR